jgi:2-polyprenyl-3-methyl-5-hydroxy-6-metoxy-1,4-benzoquinol methylase
MTNRPSTADERRRRIQAVGYDYRGVAKVPVPNCNLCGSPDTLEAARQDRYGFPAVLRLCARCGLGFLSPRPTRAEYRRFYEGTYRRLVSAYHGRTIDPATIQDDQRVYAAELLRFLKPSLEVSPGSAIDIGGSTGVVGGAISEAFGAAVTVLDPAPAELAVAEANGMETILGFVEDYEPQGRTWGLVLLCQTVDHLLDVSGALGTIAGMIGPGGRAFVDVLDFATAIRRCGSIEGAVKIDHPVYLTRETARAYFAKTGTEVLSERLSGDGHWGFVLAKGVPREPEWAELAHARDRLLKQAAR